MSKHWKYLMYVLRHKWFVFKECLVIGIHAREPVLLWRGIWHDVSKFLPSEWTPYVERFYGRNCPQDLFDLAWLFHQHRNPHHWQHWVLRRDSGQAVGIEMPKAYVLEMVADWVGAGIAITGKNTVVKWYERNKGRMTLHKKTRELVEEELRSYAYNVG